ncbi:hypothetical protein HYH02_013109 [Chlamydomonas schloesseri]|uniref:Uncharacterized protein n=1 Tax=Chlamydomonas schloesseri TaxID=2026947 RepID=A0A835SRU1_9CHLO|nr:hypothetical protein HYH02_013109 [Chlamydomonas schloesseri]|eukprot:KAG2432039.1 hypothetical protein HYH02_013109 [Chlamydomonas schloesseri]
MPSAAPVASLTLVVLLSCIAFATPAASLRLIGEQNTEAGTEDKRPLPDIKLFDSFSEIGQEQRDAWLNIWSTQAWALLQTLQAGRDKTPLHILMVGDSTMRKQMAFLCDFLEPGVQHDFHGPEVTESSCFNRELRLRVSHLWSPCCDPSELRHWSQRLADDSDGSGAAKRAAQVEPEVVYHNCGLHLMHLGAFRPFECLPRPYAEVLGGFQQAVAEVYPHALQVLMTTHSICESLFTGGYREAVDQAHWKPQVLTDACVKDLSQRLWRSKGSNADATRAAPEGVTRALGGLCRSGMMIDDTAARQRAAVLAAVEAARRRPSAAGGGGGGASDGGRGTSPSRIDVVDAYALTWQQCWASDKMDGRHYPFLVPLEAQQFLGVVSRWLLPQAAAGGGGGGGGEGGTLGGGGMATGGGGASGK